MIKRLQCKLRPSNTQGLLHDSRADVRALMEISNELVDKVNELVDAHNKEVSNMRKIL